MVVVPSAADRRQLVNGKLAYLSQALVDTTLLGGGTVVLHDSFDAADTLATIEAERITDLFLVEPQLFELMDQADVDSTDLSSLRAVVHIGASAPPTLRRRARERLGPVIAHTYGASEIGIVSALPPAEHDPAQQDRFTCAGRIHPGVEVRFRRTDGTLAEAGEAGGIEVRSPPWPPVTAAAPSSRPPRSATAGTAPATSGASTPTATYTSSAAPSTSPGPTASWSVRRCCRTPCAAYPVCVTQWS